MPTTLRGALVTDDPFHTPGYSGYIPQYKFQHGDTFARITHDLLTDPVLTRSSTSVLTETKLPPLSKSVSLVTDGVPRAGVKRSVKDTKLPDTMVPGYSGFIPCHQNRVGHRYALTSSSARADFSLENERLLASRRELARVVQQPLSMSVDSGLNRRHLAATHGTLPYISKYQVNHSRSPYYMKNGDPDKKFRSGYSGFVPRYKGKMGAGFPALTGEALTEFSDYLSHQAAIRHQPVDLSSRSEVGQERAPRVTLYPVDSGIVRHYTGHIPGEKFRNGATFAVTTTNARCLPATI